LKLLYYVDDHESNFGDDLNRWLWSRVLGSPLNVEDGVLLLGIGTIIAQGFVPPGKKYIVLGSGVGYDAPPADFGGSSWEILAVRGPLTAAALGLPEAKASTDGAALIRLLAEFEPLPEEERSGIVFMPHYELLATGNWQQVCKIAGIEFLDPRDRSEQTVHRIRKAKLVIADAMHAAIVADTLRVPWIPVVLSPQSNSFKWLDWTLSLDLPYKPVRVSASTLLEAIRNCSLRFWGKRFFFEDRTQAGAIKQYNRMRRLWSRSYWPRWRWLMVRITYLIPKRIVLSSPMSGWRRGQDESRTRRAAEQLLQIAGRATFLSEERVFNSRLEDLVGLLKKLRT
jgi:succinoglycan biosynthesis protein ExoV